MTFICTENFAGILCKMCTYLSYICILFVNKFNFLFIVVRSFTSRRIFQAEVDPDHVYQHHGAGSSEYEQKIQQRLSERGFC